MKIGIYVGRLNPTNGGEGSLTQIIIEEIREHTEYNYDFVFLYVHEKKSKYKVILENYEFINISNCCSPHNFVINGLTDSLGGGSNRFFRLDRIAKKEKIDMFYFAAPIFAQTSLPYIFTVWDLGHRSTSYFPEVSGVEWGYREKMYQKMLPRATYIITGNEQGKKELLQYYNIDENRIIIAPFPITNVCHIPEKKPGFEMKYPFFFYPAQFWAHKNHICILDALCILRDKYSIKPYFYFTGSDKGNKNYIQSMIKELQLEDQVHITGFIEIGELKYLYTHAQAMVFASLMGPNNLPPIEATAIGCPVIITDIPGHKEQMGNAALYFDGYNAESLAKAIYVSIIDKEEMARLAKAAVDLKNDFETVNYFELIVPLFDKIKSKIRRWKDV